MALDRKQLEKDYAEMAAEALHMDEYAMWQSHNVANRISVHRGAIFVLWQADEHGRPQVLDAFTVNEISLNWNRGLHVGVVSSRIAKMDWSVGQKPELFAGYDVFAWTPFFPDVRYEPHPTEEGWVLRASMCVRTKSHPDHVVPGDTYLMPVGEFRGRFPSFAATRF